MKSGIGGSKFPPREWGVGQISILMVKADVRMVMGGSVTALLSACAGAQHLGDRVDVAATFAPSVESGTAVAELDEVCDSVLLYPRSWPFIYATSWEFLRNCRRIVKTVDLVEIHEVFSFPALVTGLAARLLQIPYVVRPHGSLEPYDLRKHRLTKRLISPLIRGFLNGSGGLWLTSAREAEAVETFGARVPVFRSPLAVDEARSIGGSRTRFRSSRAISEDQFVVLFMGRIDRKKGLERTILAFERVRKQGLNAVLIIAGRGEPAYEAEVRASAESAGVGAAVVFVGHLDGEGRRDALAAADVFILHSDNENFGIAPIEALQAGLPVVLSDQVYVLEYIGDSGACVVVEGTSVDDLSRALVRLARLPSELTKMKERCRDAVRQFDPSEVAERERLVRLTVLREGRSDPKRE